MENDLNEEYRIPWNRLDHTGMFLSANRYMTTDVLAQLGVVISLALSVFQIWFLACAGGFFLLFVLVRLLVHFDLGSVDESISSVLHASEKIWLVQGEKCHIVSRTPFPFAGGMVLRCGGMTLILSDREVVVMEKHRCAGILKDDLSVRMDAVMKKEENMAAKDARVITEGVHPVCLYGRIRLSSAHCQLSLLYSHLA